MRCKRRLITPVGAARGELDIRCARVAALRCGELRGRSRSRAPLAAIAPWGASAAWPAGSRTRGLADEVVALGDVRRPAGGLDVRRRRGGQVTAQLVQVAADGVPAVP